MNVLTKGESIYDSLNNCPAKEDIDLLTRELLSISTHTEKETNDTARIPTVDKKFKNAFVEAN